MENLLSITAVRERYPDSWEAMITIKSHSRPHTRDLLGGQTPAERLPPLRLRSSREKEDRNYIAFLVGEGAFQVTDWWDFKF